jgi:hypothetical protein
MTDKPLVTIYVYREQRGDLGPGVPFPSAELQEARDAAMRMLDRMFNEPGRPETEKPLRAAVLKDSGEVIFEAELDGDDGAARARS